tara:strand:+ start:324 stop:509 length:186 start_codon:yes stop_codon:yes gene_type:complete
MNSQKVHRVTKLHASDLLFLSLQLPQPKRETTEGTTKNQNKQPNIKSVNTRYGANTWQMYM